jgi:Protein of unknown function (DUF1579)
MEKPEPTREHQWLRRLTGEWTFEVSFTGPDGQPSTSRGTERARMLGDVWLLSEGEGEIPGGGTATTLMTLGYDPQKQRFTGTFIGSMMTSLWLYEGTLEGNRLTLDTEGPSMSGDGGTSRYRDAIELVSDDERVMTSEAEGPDGTWTRFMTMTLRRTSS